MATHLGDVPLGCSLGAWRIVMGAKEPAARAGLCLSSSAGGVGACGRCCGDCSSGAAALVDAAVDAAVDSSSAGAAGAAGAGAAADAVTAAAVAGDGDGAVDSDAGLSGDGDLPGSVGAARGALLLSTAGSSMMRARMQEAKGFRN